MLNVEEITNGLFIYSPYGYIEVDKDEVSNKDTEMIKFVKKASRMCGTIRVKTIINLYLLLYIFRKEN